MNNDAAAESATSTAVPSLVGLWTLNVDSETNPQLKELNEMNITFQVPGLLDTPLYGSVNSDGPYMSHFAMADAMFDGGVTINFNITMLGNSYQFDGTVWKGTHMSGAITSGTDPESKGIELKALEEGSWSAQAQGSGDDGK